MTGPDYVPLAGSDRVRPSERLTLPRPWRQDRPADLVGLGMPTGDRFGRNGPDAGYGLKLAKRFVDRLVLTPGEAVDDVVAGCFASGANRSAAVGRAPIIYDMEWAYTLWGYLASAPERLVDLRVPLFRGASHDYGDQRAVVDAIASDAFGLTPAEVAERLASSWASLFAVET